MCGIAGFVGEDPKKIETMVTNMAHRGPDGRGVYIGNGVSFGHARLAILDPRPEGNQPMWNAEGTVAIVFNGEIYNYRKLREAEGFNCKTGTDTEVLLLLYERYGMAFVQRLRGMFAFGIYDTRNRCLHLARDPGGIKPLYLAETASGPIFASELRAVLRVLPSKPAIDYRSLSRFMSLQYVPGPQTLCQGIEAVPPGTVIRWQDGKIERRIIQAQVEVTPLRTQAEFAENLPPLIDEVVQEHLISDRPVGIFLSGGMDSSILLHHMAEQATKPIHTYTLRFAGVGKDEDEQRFNTDANLAKLTAEHYGTVHQEVVLDGAQCRDIYAAVCRHLDSPNSDSTAFAQFVLAKAAKKSVDVILTGAGGDELFGGYPRYRIARILHLLRFIPPHLRQLGASIFGYPAGVIGLSPGSELAHRLLGRPVVENTTVVKGDWFEPHAALDLCRDIYAELESSTPVRQFMEFDQKLWLVDESLRLTDAVTMSSSIESRVPFLDPRLRASLPLTPDHWHVELKRTKAILKDVYRSRLPAHLYTLKKASFFPPLAKWYRRECGVLVEEMLENPQFGELFEMSIVRQRYVEHKERRGYHLHLLSSLLQLHYWLGEVYQ